MARRQGRISKVALVSILLWSSSALTAPGGLTENDTSDPAKVPAAAAPAPAGQRITDQKNVHGLGLAFGILGASGFVYRHYIDQWFIQANGLAIYTDGGNFMAFMAGIQAGHYLSVWQTNNAHNTLPNTIALRLVGGTSYSLGRSTSGGAGDDEVPTAIDIGGADSARPSPDTSATTQDTTVERETVASFDLGIGFEVGSVMRPGFSAALDILLTVSRRNGAFHSAMPMPKVALMYSW